MSTTHPFGPAAERVLPAEPGMVLPEAGAGSARIAAVPFGPVPPGERIASIDIMRGAAVLAILFTNILIISGTPPSPHGLSFDQANAVASWFELIFIHDCVFPILSFLFGVGLALQMERAGVEGAAFLPLWTRRVLLLLCIGLTHWLLLWDAYILLQFAVLGLLLLAFRRRSGRVILGAAVLCLGMQVFSFQLSLSADRALASQPTVRAYLDRNDQRYSGWRDREIRVLQTGSYAEAVAFRAQTFVRAHTVPRRYYPWTYGTMFAMMLLGLLAARSRLFETVDRYSGVLRVLLIAGLVIGLTGRSADVVLRGLITPLWSLRRWLVVDAIGRIGALALTGAYIAGLLLLLRNTVWRERLGPIGAVGRTALSNGLLQSVLATTLFYGYGLGLYFSIGASGALGAALTILAIQVPLSVWWTARFRFGPVEWLWRSLAYGRWQPLRLPSRPAEAPALEP